MKITKVCCQGCGADLQIDEFIRYVTCNYCNARLEVVHDPTVTHTRQLDKIERTTARLADNLKVIELQNDLERLDREWDNQRQGYLVRGKNGHVSEPSSVGTIIAGVIAIVFGIFWIGFTRSMGAPGFFSLFGLVFIGAAVFGMVIGTSKAKTYQNGLHQYEFQRQRLVARLERERGN
jgi:DNA-directed RNA polymerase subunit RPC12/RpoP